MRTLLAAAGAFIAVGAVSPALAAPSLSASVGQPALVRMLPGSTPDQAAVRKKKKEKATIKEVTDARRGKKGVKIKVKVANTDRTCEMKIEFKDGSSPDIDDVDAGTDKYCVFSIDIPNNKGVTGEATMNVTVKGATGKKLAKVEGSFAVK